MKTKLQNKNIVNDAILKDISNAVHGLRNGEVVIKVQDFKIMQIDMVESNHYDDVWNVEGGGGI